MSGWGCFPPMKLLLSLARAARESKERSRPLVSPAEH